MFTAKKFLQRTHYEVLGEIIRTDPIRLRKEFLSIASDPEEDCLLRLSSLRILNFYAQVFGLFTPWERRSLMMAFENEFPPKKLKEVAEIMRSGSTGHYERWLVFCYCIAIARITLNTSSDIVNSTREVYEGTQLGSILEQYLDTIDRLKYTAERYDQMEAG